MLDERFKAKSIAAALQYFPKWALGEPATTEVLFKDTRFLIGLLVLALALPQVVELIFARGENQAGPIFDPRRGLFLLVFTGVSFGAWLAMFGIERYALLLEQLTPLVILILLSLLCGTPRAFAQAGTMSSSSSWRRRNALTGAEPRSPKIGTPSPRRPLSCRRGRCM